MATNFWGRFAKFFGHLGIELQDGTSIAKLTADPTVNSTDAVTDSIGLFGGFIYIKLDNGDTTNWDRFARLTNLDNHINDAVDAHDASAISFNNVASGLTATEVQAALDELDSVLDSVGGTLTAHVGDGTIHFTEASIDHANIQNIGTNTHAQIDTHIADATVHFTEASIDHTAIANVGTNTHAQIDTHLADGGIHFSKSEVTPYTYHVENFEVNSSANFSVSGAAVVSNETTNPLYETRSIKISHNAGDGISDILLDVAVPIQQGQQNTLNAVRFGAYSPTAGADATYRVRVQESTDDITYTDVDSFLDFTAPSQVKVHQLLFTPDENSLFLKFNLEIPVDTTVATEELIIDNLEFVTNPLPVVEFTNRTDVKQFTPSNLQGLGSVSGAYFAWVRNGERLEMFGAFATGTVTASEVQVGFPSELGNIEVSSKVGGRTLCGSWANSNSSTSGFYPTMVAGDTFFNLGRDTFGAANASSILNTGEAQTFFVSIPIEGWSATGEGVVTAGQPNEPIIEKFLTGNTTSVGDMADLTITSLTIGDWYELTGQISFYSANTNDCQVQYRSASGGTGTIYGRSRFDPEIGSGNTEDVRSLTFKFQATSTDLYVRMTSGDGNNLVRGDGTADQTFIQVEAINKPTAVISPFRTDPVCAGASSNNGQTVADGGVIIYEDELYDTNTAYDIATGVFTVPTGQGGYYRVSASIRRNAVGPVRIVIQKNSNNYARFYNSDSSIDSTVSGSCSMNLTAGDTVRVIQDIGSSITIRSTAEDNTFFIEKIN